MRFFGLAVRDWATKVFGGHIDSGTNFQADAVSFVYFKLNRGWELCIYN